MKEITYIDRISKKIQVEQIYGKTALSFIYGDRILSKILGIPLLHTIVKTPIFSTIYGFLQKRAGSRKKILPFIKQFSIDCQEFAEDVGSFKTFNDFFCRRLKPESRPICPKSNTAVIPADGRYFFYQNIDEAQGFIVKGKTFTLNKLFKNEDLADRYKGGSLVFARLCPTDYHRFHFPTDCIPNQSTMINGWLYSVNPIAIRKNIEIFTENKRSFTLLNTKNFGQIVYMEVGATNVGSIIQTYTPGEPYKKGNEKGFFSFGASSLILVFEKGKILFDKDLLQATDSGIEIKCLFGQSMGFSPNNTNSK